MSDLLGRMPGIDPVTGTLTLPLAGAAALAAIFVVLCLLAYSRSGREGPIGTLACAALVLVGAAVTWFILDGSGRRELAAERRALDARALELAGRAIAPGSALACLDASAGEAVEASCEKSLFATPESTAAAASYVAAQLALLRDGTDFARRGDATYAAALTHLRRAVELDRFGLVAQVLAMRDGCMPDRCPALALLGDPSRVSANLAERTYDAYVIRYAGAWPTGLKPPGGTAALPSNATAVAGTAPGELFFPSADSIPAVNIMSAEPGQTTGTATATPSAKPPAPPPRRQPPQAAAQPAAPPANGRAPMDITSSAPARAAVPYTSGF
jgi:hypothetical protein